MHVGALVPPPFFLECNRARTLHTYIHTHTRIFTCMCRRHLTFPLLLGVQQRPLVSGLYNLHFKRSGNRRSCLSIDLHVCVCFCGFMSASKYLYVCANVCDKMSTHSRTHSLACTHSHTNCGPAQSLPRAGCYQIDFFFLWFDVHVYVHTRK